MTRPTRSRPLPPDFRTLSAAALGDLPPGFQRLIYMLAPLRHREDLVQEAWAAFLEGRNPSTVARNALAREMLHENRERAVSQLTGEELRQYFRTVSSGKTGRDHLARKRSARGTRRRR
ncbi:MAG: hypothetical protein ISS78_12140 [Phycisphaerae bacterium]|nr:hypothetical protein [Phycisphaerae bacterium]